MSTEPQMTRKAVNLRVENLGGIDSTELSFDSGVSILPGRNATNRTSLLSALGGVLGGSTASLKSDADSGHVSLTIQDTEYTRTYSRRNGMVRVDGNPYTNVGTLVDNFVALFESNPGRRAVERNDDLRSIIMEPVDTAAIESRISELAAEKRDLEREIDDIERRKQDLPRLEERRVELEAEIADLDETLEELRTEVEAHEADINTAEKAVNVVETLSQRRQKLGRLADRLETKRAEYDALEEELADLNEERSTIEAEDESDLQSVEADLRALRDRKRTLDDTIASLTTIVEFNESVLAGDHELPLFEADSDDVTDALSPEGDRELVCWTCGSTIEQGMVGDRLNDLREVIAEKRSERDEVQERARELQSRRNEIKESTDRKQRLEGQIEDTERKLDRYEETIAELEDQIADHRDEISELEEAAANTQSIRDEELLDKYERIGDLEYERGQLQQQLADIESDIKEIESLSDTESLRTELESVEEALQTERNRIEDLERSAVESFNEHMDELLDLLGYENLARVWMERKMPSDPADDATFDLNIVRETEEPAAYEDSVENLSESEREVIGLAVALSGYLVHDVFETVPFMLLDSVEAIDTIRLDAIIDYLSGYVDYLLVALLPEDATEMSDSYDRVTVKPTAR